MHLQNHNYIEAGLTLKLHADLHDWDLTTPVDPLPDLHLPRQSAFVRKETLYLLVIDFLGSSITNSTWFVLTRGGREREGVRKCH